jgi:ssDNA-binding Zn-finger/Zn-ribbon topoisomerase 1
MKFYTFSSGGGNSNDRFSGLRFWLTTFLVVWGLSFLGLGWIVNSVFILIGVLVAIPIIGAIALQWWLSRSIVTSSCPVCEHTSTATVNSQFYCPSCGEPLQVENRKFARISIPGTIDIQVETID